MFKIWDFSAPEPEDAPIPLRLPQRLSDAETVRLLGDAFTIMTTVLCDSAELSDTVRRFGYRATLDEAQTPVLRLQSFVHRREEHRLVLNTHTYPGYARQVLNLTIPGGMTLLALERFRKAHRCLGTTHYWHDHIYGEWRTGADQPIFIELRQDAFQGAPLLLRVSFHRTCADG